MFRMQSALGARNRGQLAGLFTDLPPRRAWPAELLSRLRAAFRRRDHDAEAPADWNPGTPVAAGHQGTPASVAPPQGLSGAWGWPATHNGPGGSSVPTPLFFPPGSGTSFTIGRTRDCDLRIADMSVSRLHAQLNRGGDGWLLSDLGSHNGTRVNGWLVREPVPVRAGDLVQFGSAMFVVQTPSGQAPRGVPGVDSPP
jgi:hypothetical protein